MWEKSEGNYMLNRNQNT